MSAGPPVNRLLSRLNALIVVMMIVAGLGALPNLAATAHADPRVVTVATYDTEPFVIT